MKKSITVILAIICVLGLVGCQNTINGSQTYAFPEPTTQIKGAFYSQGKETEFVIGSEKYDPNNQSVLPVIQWFYGLELAACEQPEDVEGGEHYSFYVNEKYVFGYQDRGDEAYVIVSDTWYKVKNPSQPPIVVE